MIRGPQIPWKTRLGMIGETQVKTRLAYFSIPTKYEIDPGIDFYCELLENDSPSLPFYIQAKGTEHFDDNGGQSIRKSTLVYWLQQSFPVFLLVYDETQDVCYWMSVEQLRYHLIEQIFTTHAATVYLRMDRSNVLEQGRDRNQGFIERIKEDTALVQLFRGQAVFRGDGYVKRLPRPPRTGLELERIKENVRAGLCSLIQHCVVTQDLASAKLYCEFLASFDTNHYEHFMWLGQINAVFGNRIPARRDLRKAIEICQADKEWPRESLQPIIDSITEEFKRLV
jgi:hypothetical protein